MKARIEKKLSKKIALLAPEAFKDSWIDRDASVLAYKQGSRVSNILCMGGGADYWGEGQEEYTAWEWFKDIWPFAIRFEAHPAGHEHAGYPNIDGFKPTTINLLKLARNRLV
jgi:hypothetical protein